MQELIPRSCKDEAGPLAQSRKRWTRLTPVGRKQVPDVGRPDAARPLGRQRGGSLLRTSVLLDKPTHDGGKDTAGDPAEEIFEQREDCDSEAGQGHSTTVHQG